MEMNANAQQVLTYFRLVDDGRLEEMYALFADDILYRRSGVEPIVGKEALRAFFEGPRGIASIAHQIDIVAVDGDCVALEGRARAKLVGGSSFDRRIAEFFWFRDGLIVRRHGYVDAIPEVSA
jgi:ketosteroid isomerase-like protein